MEEDDGFVLVDEDAQYYQETYRDIFFGQLVETLDKQLKMCELYRDEFTKQNNEPMANRFAAYAIGSAQNMELVKDAWRNNDQLPKFALEKVNFNSVPYNVDIKEKELHIAVKAHNLKPTKGGQIYVVGEFEFPIPSGDSVFDFFGRCYQKVKVDPKGFFACNNAKLGSKQLDLVLFQDKVHFTKPNYLYQQTQRPLVFYVDKGKSRTLKRKYKPIKLIFYEKTSFFKWDLRLGSIQVKIDSINDVNSTTTRLPISSRVLRTQGGAEPTTDVQVRVREPLVNKSVRPLEEKILIIV